MCHDRKWWDEVVNRVGLDIEKVGKGLFTDSEFKKDDNDYYYYYYYF